MYGMAGVCNYTFGALNFIIRGPENWRKLLKRAPGTHGKEGKTRQKQKDCKALVAHNRQDTRKNSKNDTDQDLSSQASRKVGLKLPKISFKNKGYLGEFKGCISCLENVGWDFPANFGLWKILLDAAFLLTVGSFLLTVELFYLQLCLGAFLVTALAFYLPFNYFTYI